jgi:hypothetical protein
VGRIKRQIMAALPIPTVTPDPICPLCNRPIPRDQQDAHHLVPRSEGGKQTVLLHRICHRQIHALFTEVELARYYATIEALNAHPDMMRFLQWVATRPDGFSERVRKSRRKRGDL